MAGAVPTLPKKIRNKTAFLVIIISLAIRQYAACFNIDHSQLSRKKKPSETKGNPCYLPSVTTFGLSAPFAALATSFSLRSKLHYCYCFVFVEKKSRHVLEINFIG